MLGGIQPKKLAEMAKTLDPDGLLQRFLPIVGDNVRRTGIDRAPDASAISGYTNTIQGLAEVTSFADLFDDRVVTLSPEAQQIRLDFERRVNLLLDAPQMSDAWRGHLKKRAASSPACCWCSTCWTTGRPSAKTPPVRRYPAGGRTHLALSRAIRSLTPCSSTKRSLAAVPPGTRHGGRRALFWCSRNPWCDAATCTRSIGRGGRTALRPRAPGRNACPGPVGLVHDGRRRARRADSLAHQSARVRAVPRTRCGRSRAPTEEYARVMASVAERKALNSSSQAGAPARVTARVAPCVAAGVFQ